MVLQLELRAASPPIDLEGVVPDALHGRSLAEIERLPLRCGNREVPLAELFAVRGVADDTLELLGDLTHVRNLGAKLTAGRIIVRGTAGDGVGRKMRGGEILVEGNAGDGLGSEMRGGTIRVRGSAGDGVGGAERGGSRGMTRGTIVVEGSAGRQVGAGMRRGLIAIGGNAGEFAGYRLLAGTIVVLGAAGANYGAEMKRGTLALLGSVAPPLPTFRCACTAQPAIIPLLFRHLRELNFAAEDAVETQPLGIRNGDRLAGGRGEVWRRDPA